MKTAAKYWNLVRLDSSGKVRTTEIGSAKQFFQQQFTDYGDRLSDSLIQQELVAVKNNVGEAKILAERCLRCFISHQIRQACTQLDLQFGKEHHFSRQDLLIYTLNDTLDNFRDRLSTTKNNYQPLAVEILATFDPSKANLSTWTNRYVRQHRELQRFLLEQGVYLISNWAILNDTSIKQLTRICQEFHNLTPPEIEQASTLLNAYHGVYRRDRLSNPQAKGSKCLPPTPEQWERIAKLVSQSDLILSQVQTQSQLAKIAQLLREYRVYVRGGQRKQESLDNVNLNTQALQAEIVQPEDEPVDRSNFLRAYQQRFQQSLDDSIHVVIQTRLDKFQGKKAAKAPQFITALELFHCQGVAMRAIAAQVGLKAQFQVSRLLKLKELRADIRQTMLQQLQDWTLNNTKSEDFSVLKQREMAIESALGAQIDLVLDEAQKEASVGDSTHSVLAKRICALLDRFNH